MSSFAVSICALSIAQGVLVAVPANRELAPLRRLRSGWWAVLPAASVAAAVFGIRSLTGVAHGLAYLALVTVPPLAAAALGWGIRGARPWLAGAVVPLFALAWADRAGLAGETAGLLLDMLSVVTLGILLVAVTPRALVKVGILAMAVVDTWLVVANLLQAPNRVLGAAAPAAHLPQLQRVVFGAATMGYGDFFLAAVLGALLAARARDALGGAAAVVVAALAFDTLFLAVGELPATVPVAIALLGLELRRAIGARRHAAM